MDVKYYFQSIGEVLHGEVYTPSMVQSGEKFPTILYVYGGPHIQVSNDHHL